MSLPPRSDSLPDLMGIPSQQIGSGNELLYRLWSFHDRSITRGADRILKCKTDPLGWRCGISTLCGSCGKRAAVRERRSLQRETLGTVYLRAIVTRTVKAVSIAEGHRILKQARAAQNRSVGWRGLVLFSRGRIEAKRTRDDDAWNVHGHEVALLHPGVAPSTKELRRSWTKLLGREGCAGNFDLRVIDEGTAARGGGTVRPAVLLRDQEETPGAGPPLRRRSTRMGNGDAWTPLGAPVRRAAGNTSTNFKEQRR